MDRRSALDPSHVGEALVEALFENMSPEAYSKLEVLDPRTSTKFALASLESVRPRAVRNASLARLPSGARFDGAHTIDIALIGDGRARAIELKLGEFGLGLPSVRKMGASPRLSGHGHAAVSGKMIGILDHNGRDSSAGSVRLALADTQTPVEPGWLLMVRARVLRAWQVAARKTGTTLSDTLGLRQLVGIIVLEELLAGFGREAARELALSVLTEALHGWPLWRD